jgi:hypothetical protein
MSRKWGDPELDRSQFALDQFRSALEVYEKERQALWQAIMQEPVDTLRASYRPERITTLFVGESPPINGTFFYDGDNSMVNYMQKAVESVLPGEGAFLFLYAPAPSSFFLTLKNPLRPLRLTGAVSFAGRVDMPLVEWRIFCCGN